MNILEQKYPAKQLVKIIKILQLKDSLTKLVGTGALASQLFPADYDFLCNVDAKYHDPDIVFNEFGQILSKIFQFDKLFFIELKFQNRDESKHKIFHIDEFTREMFDKYYQQDMIDYIKIDAITTIVGEFKEVSCIYFFNPIDRPLEEYRNLILDDSKDYYNEGKYYKSLKRLMSASIKSDVPDLNFIKLLTSLFNSDIGKKYAFKNEIDECIIYLDKYSTPYEAKRVQNYLIDNKLRGIKLDSLPKISEKYGKVIDRSALDFYRNHKIPIGKLPKYNTVKL